MGVSENGGTPKSSNLIGISIINHPFWGTPIFGNTHMSTKITAPETPGSDDQSTIPPTSRKVEGSHCQRLVTPAVVSKPSFCRADSNHF